jgi:hypothetical protein
VTISFPQDGTPVGRYANRFADALSHLDEKGRRSEILRAFLTWSQVANVDFALVRDGQNPLGTIGLSQGDPRFGDVRIVAAPLGVALANAVPFSPTGGSWAGDILLNSEVTFTMQPPMATRAVNPFAPTTWVTGAQTAAVEAQTTLVAAYREFAALGETSPAATTLSDADLWTVVLHEAGNALGLPDNNDPTSVMYAGYTGPRTTLSAADVQAIRALYGARPADRYETPAGSNNTRRTATLIRTVNTPVQTVVGELTPGDQDWYRYLPPAGETQAVFRLKAAGSSLLLGRLQGYDSTGKELFELLAEEYHGRQDLAIKLGSYTPGRPLFFRVSMTTKLPGGHPFGVGRYQLELDRRPDADATVDPSPFEPLGDDDAWAHSSSIDLEELLAANPGLFAEPSPNDTLATATSLTTAPGFPDGSRFEGLGAINTAADRDVFRWSRTPGDDRRFVIAIDPIADADDELIFAAYDDQGRFLPATSWRDPSGCYRLELSPLGTTTTVALAIGRADAAVATLLPYTLVIDRVRTDVPADGLQAGTLTEAARYFGADWRTDAAQLFRFDLTAELPAGMDEPAGVQVLLFDARGEIAVNLATVAAQESHVYALVQPGEYDIRIAGLTPSLESPLVAVDYQLTWVAISDDVGPLPVDISYPTYYYNPVYFPPLPPPPPIVLVPYIPTPTIVPVPIPAADPWITYNMYLYYNFLPLSP